MKLAIILITIGITCIVTGVVLLRKSKNTETNEEFYKDDLILESNRTYVIGNGLESRKTFVVENASSKELFKLHDGQKAFIEQEKAKGKNGCSITTDNGQVWIDFKNK